MRKIFRTRERRECTCTKYETCDLCIDNGIFDISETEGV